MISQSQRYSFHPAPTSPKFSIFFFQIKRKPKTTNDPGVQQNGMPFPLKMFSSCSLTRPQSSLSARRGIRARGIDEGRETRGRGKREG